MSLTNETFGRRCLNAIGSLWLAAVLLVLVLAALASATVFESTSGTEHALAAFYSSAWFAALLELLCINILAAVIVRFVVSTRKIGFLLTHLAVVLILIGAITTRYFGVQGRLVLVEGESSDQFRVADEAVTLRDGATGVEASIQLSARIFGRLEPVNAPRDVAMNLSDVSVSVVRYLPDSASVTRVVNDAPRETQAVELLLTDTTSQHRAWLLEGETLAIGLSKASLTVVESTEELTARLQTPTTDSSASAGKVMVDVAGHSHFVPMETCRDAAVPVGDTPYSIRVLEFFPHATVGQGGQLTNASNDPVNPAIRAEITGPNETWTTIAFANFPDFRSTHGQNGAADVKVTFEYSGKTTAPVAPIELFAVRNGPIHVRFAEAPAVSSAATESDAPAAHALDINQPVSTPAPGRSLTLLTRFDRAERRRTVEMPDEIREDRTPAVNVAVRHGEHVADLWLEKNQPRSLNINGGNYELLYADAIKPMGFSVRLDDFTVGYYPGGRRPRSFESRITITDPATGLAQSRLISMNHPTSFGGFTFYQSSYQQLGDRELSVLSVARDPGMAIVFTGYFCLMIGMVWVLVVRVGDHRRATRVTNATHAVRTNGRSSIPLTLAGSGCVNGYADGTSKAEPQPRSPSLPRAKRDDRIRNKHEVSS
jgi:hypothetical protein